MACSRFARARAHALHVRTHGIFGRHIYAYLHLESVDFMVIFLTKIIESRDPVCRRYFYITRTRNITIPAAQGDIIILLLWLRTVHPREPPIPIPLPPRAPPSLWGPSFPLGLRLEQAQKGLPYFLFS